MDPVSRIANIGPVQRRRRRVLGVAALALALAVGALLWVTGAARPVRLVLAPLVLGGVLGVLQAREKT